MRTDRVATPPAAHLSAQGQQPHHQRNLPTRGAPAKYGMPDTECQIRKSRYGMPDTECQIRKARYGMPDKEGQIRNARYGMPDTECQIRKARYRMPNKECGVATGKPKFATTHPGHHPPRPPPRPPPECSPVHRRVSNPTSLVVNDPTALRL